MSERLKWWFWHFASLLRDPLFLYLLQCPPSMRRIPGTLHHRWRMALFGAIQLPSRLGRFQSRTEAHGMRYSVRDVHAHSCIKGGGGLEGRGGRRWGEMSPRLGVGAAPKFPSSTPTPRTTTTPSQDGAVDVPTTPSTVAFPAFPERMAQADPSFRPPSILPRTPGIHPRKLKSRPRCGG